MSAASAARPVTVATTMLSSIRMSLSVEAVYEISALAAMLRTHIETNDSTGACKPQARGVLGRIELLTDAIHECLVHEDWSDEQLERIVMRGGCP